MDGRGDDGEQGPEARATGHGETVRGTVVMGENRPSRSLETMRWSSRVLATITPSPTTTGAGTPSSNVACSAGLALELVVALDLLAEGEVTDAASEGLGNGLADGLVDETEGGGEAAGEAALGGVSERGDRAPCEPADATSGPCSDARGLS